MSKTIEERAKEYMEQVYVEGNEIYESELHTAFCDGANSEHEELTRWNSPDCPPDNDRQILLKVKTDFSGKIYYKVGSFINGDYCESYSGRPLRTKHIGWREIHE